MAACYVATPVAGKHVALLVRRPLVQRITPFRFCRLLFDSFSKVERGGASRVTLMLLFFLAYGLWMNDWACRVGMNAAKIS